MQNASDASAAASLLAPSAQGWIFRNHAANAPAVNRTSLLFGISGGTQCCQTSAGGVLTQGSFIAHTYILTNPNLIAGPNAADEGIEVLKLNAGGQIEYIWHVDTQTNLTGSAPPAASGG